MTVHYLNKGTKYHIGNNEYPGSVDKEFIDCYPIVGEAWAIPFTVSKDDQVEVIIQNLWGVDYGDNNRVYINDTDIGEITGEHNRKGWASPSSWSLNNKQTYLLKIASLPPGYDDFVFEGVMVRTSGNSRIKTQGPPKILKNVQEDYYQSTFDTKKTKRLSSGFTMPSFNITKLFGVFTIIIALVQFFFILDNFPPYFAILPIFGFIAGAILAFFNERIGKLITLIYWVLILLFIALLWY